MTADATTTTTDLVATAYRRQTSRIAEARAAFGRPLTFAEKVLAAHTAEPLTAAPERGITDVDLVPDRVALQDALAQIVALQFMTAGLDEVVTPTTVHCDHLIRARAGAGTDLQDALGANREVYEFLRSVCQRYGIGFWPPGSGIIHQVLLEQYAFPGGMMIGTDSHTPNAGGLGMVAVGVGGGDAIDVMTGSPFGLRWPRLIGIRLSGELSGWSSPKDLILRVADLLTTSGGTGAVVEYLGPGARTLAATGKATVCNMGAELGATTSLFPFDEHTARYLRATGRDTEASAAELVAADLGADPEVEADPERFFDRVLEIDLSSLRPLVNGPDSPDLAHAVGDLGAWAAAQGIPTAISSALIGSCTNSSYEDLGRAAAVARQAAAAGLRARTPLFVTPGSEQVRATIERDGILDDLRAIGATVLANACGPCIGQWDRSGDDDGPTTILTSFNRNFPRRNDGRASTKAFVASPELVVAYALAGTLETDPTRDPLPTVSGAEVRLLPPEAAGLPAAGFAPGAPGFVRPGPAQDGVTVAVAPTSERLQRLEPFPAWDGADFVDLPVLVKANGRCTTDHISAAGPWLAYRGHLERISANLFLGAVNAFDGATGRGKDPLDGAHRPFPEIAARLSAAGVRWCVVGDENYGEGSSREHAAMEPRYRGAVVVLARSFARIHETNLKKQGLLALTFADPTTYDRIGEDDRIGVHGLASIEPGRAVRCTISRPDGTEEAFLATHTCTDRQLAWFRAGSALNVVRQRT